MKFKRFLSGVLPLLAASAWAQSLAPAIPPGPPVQPEKRIVFIASDFKNGAVMGAHGEPLSVGITPLKPAAKLAEEWTPLLDEVAKRAGLALRFRTATSIPVYGERLEKGEYDIAYMNPYDYQVYSASVGYRAFVRERGQPLEGVLLVRKDGRIKELRGIHGARVSFPTPLAFAASLLTQAEMLKQGIKVDA